MRKVLVNGAGGFIGGHLVHRLKAEGCWVRGVDIRAHEFQHPPADEWLQGDLRDAEFTHRALEGMEDVYQLAADMGGAGYLFSGEHDADVVHNSAQINLNTARSAARHHTPRIFFSSSACVYPERNQMDPNHPDCREDSAYPAAPDSEYGWEKLFSERLYASFSRNYGIKVRIARFHNVFGPLGTWTGGKEKAPAAICRKVAEVSNGGEIEVWGDGRQTRSFLYVDECLEGIRRLMESQHDEPLNIGSSELLSIDELVDMVAAIAGKKIKIRHVPGPLGVRGRCSDNERIRTRLGWEPSRPLEEGLEQTYRWIAEQVARGKS